MPHRNRFAECPPDHTHAKTSTCYKRHGCGCDPCRARNAKRSHQSRVRAVTRTTEPPVDATRTRKHLERLTAAGFAHYAIAARAGVGPKAVANILTGKTKTVYPVTEAAILGVDPARLTIPAQRSVNAAGTRRRLEALIWSGWPITELLRMLGRRPAETRMLTSSYVHKATADAVAALYDRLIHEAAPDTYGGRRAALRARRKGYAGPDAWIDRDIDDPEAEPDMSTAADEPGWIVNELAHLHALGESAAIALTAFPQQPDTLLRAAERHKRPDIAAWIRTAGKAA